MEIILIVLTATAWFRGWRWCALWPVTILCSTGFLIGISMETFGVMFTNDQQWVIIGAPLYLVTGIALLIMTVIRPHGSNPSQLPVATSGFKLP
ncbi:MAG: hypothetical protein H6969_06735 [Gammaproteobacteria bacterium]|nr:hypothetical protein [Gammaproteobacteria bacterium]